MVYFPSKKYYLLIRYTGINKFDIADLRGYYLRVSIKGLSIWRVGPGLETCHILNVYLLFEFNIL